MTEYQTDIARDGYALVRNALSVDALAELQQATQPLLGAPDAHGVRNLMEKIPAIRQLATAPMLRGIVDAVLGPTALPVRAIFFDKTPDANWYVTWHQDLSIAVKSRAEVQGYGPWSVKAGVPHVQPPIEVLRDMLTLRVHLDRADAGNGALWVIPGSHRKGRLAAADIERVISASTPVLCDASAGDVLAMSPLILHSSRKANVPSHRRVVHLEYAAGELAPPLQWHEDAA